MAYTLQLYAGTDAGGAVDARTLLLFTWQPKAGAAALTYEEGLGSDALESRAQGDVVFSGQSVTAGFAARPMNLEFRFSNWTYVSEAHLTRGLDWTWDPTTGVLDPRGDGGGWTELGLSMTRFTAAEAQAEMTSAWDGHLIGIVEPGRWVPMLEPIRYDIQGGHGRDTLVGSTGSDTLTGGRGDDLLVGMEGDDRLNGHDGSDTIRGGAGNDHVQGAQGNDLIETGDGQDLASGGSGNDTLRGGAGHDTLAGFLGDDLILGEDGNDVLQPGEGHDTLDGGEGFDTFDLRQLDWQGRDVAAPVDMVVRLDGGYAAPDQRGWLRQISISNIEAVIGSRGCDVIVGDAGWNVLDGGGGVENTLTGGAGGDRFVLGRGQSLALRLDGTPVAPLTQEWITDFSAAEGDRIDLHHFGVAAAAVSLVEAWGDLHIHLADAAGGLHQVATLYGLTAAAMGPSWMIV